MFHSKTFTLAALAWPLMTAALSASTAPWQSAPFAAAPAEVLQAATADSPKDADVVVLSTYVHYVYDAEGKKTVTERRVFRIINETAISGWSAVTAPYAPWYQERPTIRARVITTDGAVHELDPATVDDAPAEESGSDIYSDNRVLQAPLPALAKGAVVEVEIITRDKALFFAGGAIETEFFYAGATIKSARLVIDAPSSLTLSVVNRLGSIGRESRTEKDGMKSIVFEANDVVAPEEFEFSVPGDVRQLPYVSFSTGSSWNDVARRYAAIVDQQIAGYTLPENLKASLAAAKSRDAKIAILLARLHQDVRYTGIEFGEASIVPRTPSEVLKRKYGDCKDKASLLVAMLRAAGIEANVAALRAGYGSDVEKELPGFGSFNHAIVVVRGNPDLWIDPTDEFARAGELPTADQARFALIADGKSEALTTTPRLTSRENRFVQTRRFQLKESGPAHIIETSVASGVLESAQRHMYAETDAKAMRESMKQYGGSAYNSDEQPTYRFSTPSDLSKPFDVTIELNGKRGITNRGIAAVAVFPAGLLERLPWQVRSDDDDDATDVKKRQHDFIFHEPFTEEWHYVIEPPTGFRARELPAAEERAIGPFTLSRKFAVQPSGVVTADLKFDVNRERITVAEFEKMKSDISALESEEPLLVNFELTAAALLESGNIRDSLAEFRRLVALHPKEALHHSQLALALLQAGLGEQARNEARLATRMDEKSADAFRTLGWILQHDLLGRRFHKGFDREGSIVAYRKSKELDPKDVETRADLAILLEHDAKGDRYTPQASLTDAIAEYRSIKSELKNENVNDNLLHAVMWKGDFTALRDAAKETAESPARNTMLILAASRLEGSDAAFRLADALVSDKEQRRSILATVASSLMQQRYYAQAGEFFERLASGAPNAAELTARAALIKTTRRLEEVKYDANDPTSVVAQLFVTMVKDDDAAIDALLPLFTDDLRPEIKREGEAFLLALRGRGFRGANRDGALPALVMADVALGSLEFKKEGDEATGFRIKPQSKVGTNDTDIAFFVVKEGGQYRIAGTGLAPSTLAFQIEQRLQKGDVAGARQWLDWARDEMNGMNDDHPFAEHPMVRFWRKGKNDDSDPALASAALSALGGLDGVARAVTRLTAARPAATPERQLSIDVALLNAYSRLRKAPELLEVATRLLAERPDSDQAFTARVAALVELQRFDDVRKMANDRLARDKRDVVAMRTLSEVAGQRSEYDSSASYLEQIIDHGEADAGVYNSLAWLALFRQPFVEQSIATARKAADLTGTGNSAILHTLAALYAEAGKTTEARQVILKEMDIAGSVDPRSEDWYVLGRIAEQYGEVDAAVALYRKVEKPKDEGLPLSTYFLAEKRLKAIGRK
jgi:tetratricopeptide (TPR) repeat protein/transglutaminase-like putative cysteine protease